MPGFLQTEPLASNVLYKLGLILIGKCFINLGLDAWIEMKEKIYGTFC